MAGKSNPNWQAGSDAAIFVYTTADEGALTALVLPERAVHVQVIAGDHDCTIVGASNSTTVIEVSVEDTAASVAAATKDTSLDVVPAGETGTGVYAVGGCRYFLVASADADTINLRVWRNP